MIPLGILAVIQMVLNYVRFDNIFEFGAKYQLTSFNMISCMSVTFGKSIGGILEYIFRTPLVNPLKFPFVFVNRDTSLVSMNEICYENRLVGLISIAILFVYLFKNYILKNEDELNKILWEEIKELNKTFPPYKYIKNMILTDEELIKTTTLKIKRHEEMKKIMK